MASAGLRGDQRIVRSDWLTARFEKSADFPGLARILNIEWRLEETGR